MRHYTQVNDSELFELDNPMTNQYFWLAFLKPESLTDKQMWQLFKGEWKPFEPVVLKAYRGGRPADFMWLGAPPNVFVSQKVIDILIKSNFTGWATYPVKIFNRKDELLPGYHGLAIISWVGDQDFNRSELIDKPPYYPGGPPWRVYKGIYFDETRWDGSDIFRINEGIIAISSHVQKSFKQAKVNNVRLIALSEVETSSLVYEAGRKLK